jgi:hypothetical protein
MLKLFAFIAGLYYNLPVEYFIFGLVAVILSSEK